MEFEHTIKPIAHIRTDFKEKFGIPRQSGQVDSLVGRIVFLPQYRDPDYLREIDGFSHLWLIFDFSQAHLNNDSPTVRPPRLGGNRRVGVFASRSPFRPNSLGLSSVRLLGIEQTKSDGKVLIVSGADLLDNTPIYDIKPYLPFTDSHPDALAGYAGKVYNHKLTVDISDEAEKRIPPQYRNAIVQSIEQDPRPSYQEDSERIYSMKFANLDVHFTVSGDCATVVSVSSGLSE